MNQNEGLDKTGYFSALFLNSKVNACIQMDTDGTIRCVNQAFKSTFGYDDEDVADQHFSMLFTREDCAQGRPASEISNVLSRGQADDKNFLVHKNKTISWVSGESILVEHENGERSLLKIIQDIHQQKDFENSLVRVNDFNEVILKAIDDFVLILDSSLHVITANPAFSRLFPDCEPLSMSDFITFIRPYDKQEAIYELLQEVVNSGKTGNRKTIGINAGGNEKIFELTCQPIHTTDTDNALLLVGHDITIQQKAELEREDLMGFVAHELRSPLASILMSNDLMSFMVNAQQTDQLKQLLDKNKKNIERLSKMIAELYDATKVGGGNFMLTKADFNFDEMLLESIETFRVLQPSYRFIFTGSSGILFHGDRYRIQQVLSNYLSNAVKYSSEGTDIHITVKHDQQQITVAVADTGIGIDSSQMAHIFERFFRTEKARKQEGIGLGLYLCRRIIQAHGGRVWADSEDGKGSVFHFSLPLK